MTVHEPTLSFCPFSGRYDSHSYEKRCERYDGEVLVLGRSHGRYDCDHGYGLRCLSWSGRRCDLRWRYRTREVNVECWRATCTVCSAFGGGKLIVQFEGDRVPVIAVLIW